VLHCERKIQFWEARMQIEFPASPLTAPWIAFGQSVARETQATAFQSYERWHALFFGALGAGETRPEPQEKPAPKAKPVPKAALAKPIEPATAEEPKVAAAKIAAKPLKIVMKSAPAPKVEAPTTALKAVAKPAPVVARVPEPAAAKPTVVAPLALVPRPVEAVFPVLVAPAAVATPALPAKTVPAKAALAAVAPAVSEEATSVMIPLPLRNAPKAEKPAKSGSKVVLMLDASEIDPAGTFDDAKVTKVEPLYLAKPDGKADDLKKIKGIGGTLERLLNDLGLWHYRQIAALTPGEIAWVNSKIDFKGRVQRDKWVSQARTLLG
jgi:predicted flap endonuclease-1-like 5' DNA nuclease